jgi:hypothetical protein
MPRRTANAATQARSSVSGHTRGVLAAMRERPERHGRLPTSYDWSRTHASARGQALERLGRGDWPAATAVTGLFGTWSAARAVAAERSRDMTREPALEPTPFGRESISLPKPRETTAKTEDLRGGESTPERTDLQVLLAGPRISPIIRVGEAPGSNPGAPTQKTPQIRGFLLGKRAWLSGGDWAKTSQHRNLAVSKGASEQEF